MSFNFKPASAKTSPATSVQTSLPVLHTRRRLVKRPIDSSHKTDNSITTPSTSPSNLNNINLSPIPSATLATLPNNNNNSTVNLSQSTSPQERPQGDNDCLKGVVAYLDIRTEDGDDVSQNFENVVKSMGAKIRKTFADTVTHLIYKNGSSMNVKKAIHNKCKIVNLLWITNCKSKGTRLPEVNYLIEQPENLLLPGLKKRKSMEPGQVKALILDEQVEKLTLSKRSGTTQNTQLSKRPKPASSKYTSAIISKEATNINNLDRSSLLTNRKFRSGGSGESLSSAIHIIPDRQVQPTCSSFESAKDMSIKNSAPESQKPQVNKSIKAGFYIGNQSQTETSSSTSKSTKTSTAIPTTPTTKSPLLVRRKRRSVMMSSPTPTAATIIKPSSDLHHPLPDLVRPNSDDTSNLPSIVMTNMTEQEKKTCSNIISKLGTYRVATSVDKTTTHIIVGCQRRTESVIMGLLYGTWLVTPAWLLDSMKLNRYLAESDYEAILLFPRANAARRRDPLLPSNTHIYINSAACTIHHDLAQEIVTKAGGTVVGNPEKADIVISNTLMATGAIVVMENWILDSIEQWQYLSTSKYIPPAN